MLKENMQTESMTSPYSSMKGTDYIIVTRIRWHIQIKRKNTYTVNYWANNTLVGLCSTDPCREK